MNGGAFASPKLHVVNADAFVWLKQNAGPAQFDFVVVDFPDPSNFSVGKLYSLTFYRLLRQMLAPGRRDGGAEHVALHRPPGLLVRGGTLEAAGFATVPYHVYVPSFGEWGFVLAGVQRRCHAGRLPARPALRHRRDDGRHAPFPAGHGPRADRHQPAR